MRIIRKYKKVVGMFLLAIMFVGIMPVGMKANAAGLTREEQLAKLREIITTKEERIKKIDEILNRRKIELKPMPTPNPRLIPRPEPIRPPVEIRKIDDGRLIPKPEPILPPVVEDDPIEEPKEPVMSPIEPVEEEIIKPNKPIRIIIPIQPERPRFWDRLIPRPEPIKPPVCYK